MPDSTQATQPSLDIVQHPTLGELKFPKNMPYSERNQIIDNFIAQYQIQKAPTASLAQRWEKLKAEAMHPGMTYEAAFHPQPTAQQFQEHPGMTAAKQLGLGLIDPVNTALLAMTGGLSEFWPAARALEPFIGAFFTGQMLGGAGEDIYGAAKAKTPAERRYHEILAAGQTGLAALPFAFLRKTPGKMPMEQPKTPVTPPETKPSLAVAPAQEVAPAIAAPAPRQTLQELQQKIAQAVPTKAPTREDLVAAGKMRPTAPTKAPEVAVTPKPEAAVPEVAKPKIAKQTPRSMHELLDAKAITVEEFQKWQKTGEFPLQYISIKASKEATPAEGGIVKVPEPTLAKPSPIDIPYKGLRGMSELTSKAFQSLQTSTQELLRASRDPRTAPARLDYLTKKTNKLRNNFENAFRSEVAKYTPEQRAQEAQRFESEAKGLSQYADNLHEVINFTDRLSRQKELTPLETRKLVEDAQQLAQKYSGTGLPYDLRTVKAQRRAFKRSFDRVLTVPEMHALADTIGGEVAARHRRMAAILNRPAIPKAKLPEFPSVARIKEISEVGKRPEEPARPREAKPRPRPFLGFEPAKASAEVKEGERFVPISKQIEESEARMRVFDKEHEKLLTGQVAAISQQLENLEAQGKKWGPEYTELHSKRAQLLKQPLRMPEEAPKKLLEERISETGAEGPTVAFLVKPLLDKGMKREHLEAIANHIKRIDADADVLADVHTKALMAARQALEEGEDSFGALQAARREIVSEKNLQYLRTREPEPGEHGIVKSFAPKLKSLSEKLTDEDLKSGELLYERAKALGIPAHRISPAMPPKGKGWIVGGGTHFISAESPKEIGYTQHDTIMQEIVFGQKEISRRISLDQAAKRNSELLTALNESGAVRMDDNLSYEKHGPFKDTEIDAIESAMFASPMYGKANLLIDWKHPIDKPVKALVIPPEDYTEMPLREAIDKAVQRESRQRGVMPIDAFVPRSLAQLGRIIQDKFKGKLPKERIKATQDIIEPDPQKPGLTAFARLKGLSAAIWSLKDKPVEWTNFKALKGEYDFAIQRANHDAWKFAKAMADSYPDKEGRAAISVYIDAGGDIEYLKNALKGSASAKYQKIWERATQLTDTEKEVAKHIIEFNKEQAEESIREGFMQKAVDNYIHRIWKRPNPQANTLVHELYFSKLNTKPSWVRQRIFEHTADGINEGRHPETLDFARLQTVREVSFRTALAARDFWRGLLDMKEKDGRPSAAFDHSYISVLEPDMVEHMNPAAIIRQHVKPQDMADYRMIDHSSARRYVWSGKDSAGNNVFAQGNLLVHPDRYHEVRNMLTRSWWDDGKWPITRALKRFAIRGPARAKGLLFTGSMFHEVNITRKVYGWTTDWTKPKDVKSLLHPPEIDFDKDPMARQLVKHGTKLVPEFRWPIEFAEGLTGGIPLPKFLDKSWFPFSRAYSQRLFVEQIPKLKLMVGKLAYAYNKQAYPELSEDQLWYQAANQANATTGELNATMLGRSKTTQDTLRLIFLAPDFFEAQARTVGQALSPWGKAQRVAVTRLALHDFITYRILNAAMNNGNMHTADAPFGVVHKDKDGREREYSFRAVYGDVFHLLNDPRGFLYWRINPYTVREGLELLEGRGGPRGEKQTLTQNIESYLSDFVPLPVQYPFRQASSETAMQSWLYATAGMSTIVHHTRAEKILANAHTHTDAPLTSDIITRNRLKWQVRSFVLKKQMDRADDLLNNAERSQLITRKQRESILKWARTPLIVNYAENMDLKTLKKAWNVATPEEQKLLYPIIQKKIARVKLEGKKIE